ncbi:Protein CBG09042 [Caenorhabditis briggsae]|uniref:Protein CBG09042 n=1 Tax=Caenorhabditis briggsae TaxID=6238 RepID=A8X7Y3_CAEBR|nr:Protein CBG09042 [Caenorhabditis briggsae]CAP28744.2 Protein CBG09042 [Caenorhabditis briggsae]
MPSDDRFADAVKPALEALLSDLQHTTEVLRRAHISDRRSQVVMILEEILMIFKELWSLKVTEMCQITKEEHPKEENIQRVLKEFMRMDQNLTNQSILVVHLVQVFRVFCLKSRNPFKRAGRSYY